MRFNSLAGSSAILAIMAATLATAPALASETPLYQPAPAWVTPAPAIDPAKAAQGSPLMIFDMQQRIDGDKVWNYVDTAFRADTPNALTQLGTLSASWSPDKGDLIIHRVVIIRGSEEIDVLGTAKFDVLRREQQLEKRSLDGELTSTMAVPGLRVGDIVRLTLSTTRADAALAGHVQSGAPVMAEPFSAGFARVRILWPEGKGMRWQAGPKVDLSQDAAVLNGGYRELNLPIPIAKRPEMPADSPSRYRSPPWFQLGNFAGWEDVSKVMAPLFATDGLIAPGSPLAAEVATIASASSDPLERTARALELVQGKIAYLAVSMNGGNYVPQPPAKTWELRYGDCKAKTLLLLSMLRAMGIEAEAVLARSQGGDALPTLLPMPADFDHVLVHARIGGKDLWLDGTTVGTRKVDLADAPPFFHVLPLKPAGSGLLAITPHANVRPNVAVTLKLDHSAGVDLPSIFDVSLAFRGAEAAQLNTQWVQAPVSQHRDMLNAIIQRYAGQVQISTQSFTYDDRSSVATITARGLLATDWKFERGGMRQQITLLQSSFEPDRARPLWRDIPVATEQAVSRDWNTRFILPDGGKGYTIDGDPAISAMLGGAHLVRSGSLSGGVYSVIERIDQTGSEIAAADVSTEKARVAAARAATVALVAPPGVRRSWQYGDAASRALLRPVEAVLAAAIADQPDKPEPLETRANLRSLVLDWRGAVTDIGRAIALEPRANDLLMRSALLENMGEQAGALKDAISAQDLDPASSAGIGRRAGILSRMGRHDEALALLQERIDAAGQDRFEMISAQADLMSDAGKAAEAISLLDSTIATKPGDPVLLNTRCWIKATRGIALDTALRDCTKAIELSENSAQILDSRAMVYFRMGRMEDAMADYDAALQAVPSLAPSILMRGVILKHGGNTAEGQPLIDQALRMDPTILPRFKGYGIEL